MRQYKKKELLETADMLVEANEVIGRLCKSNTERALEILGQCQESAILLGNLIESKGDGYAELIEILENYCENIYQMSIAVSDEEQIRKLSKKIQKQLTYLNNKIRQEMPEDKKEIVFFPYKASMWDSLESVWMAADADEDTDAYVVPIPYYDKNPDGSFREMHYEGDQYPDYVPVTNYEEYDFEERRPDIIFIHNPYDEFNYVTSVHPRFYSKNLKKFTEKLVYIPYFILNEVDPDDDAAIEGMKHFCINEAVKNADKVIVQSEDMRQVYIKVLTEESGGSKEARTYWEKKIDGSGSPKVDKVLRTKKEDLEIPEEWLKVIQKPDGSYKKIIFYNTSVTALLRHDEQMLKKMESVFQTFYENRDEVALLWRPHPLMESTLVSMRPQLWEEYRKIRDKYREESWGIYDDTADMDRAVILSDMYYGDGSSIVQLYQKTGKPMMMQNVEIISESEEVLLSTYHIAIIGNDVYFAAKNDFGIFKYDRQTNKTEQICIESYPIGDISSRFAFGGTVICDGKVVFAPYICSKILLYDIYAKATKVIDVDQALHTDKKRWYYVKTAAALDNSIYFICGMYSEILCFDIRTLQINVVDAWKKALVLETGMKEFIGVNTGGDVCIVGKSLWVPVNYNNYILEINMKTQKTNIYKINVPQMRFLTICFDGSYFWLTGEKQVVVKWSKLDGQVKLYDRFPDGFQKFLKEGYWEQLFSRSFYQDGYVYLFPLAGNMVLKIQAETGQMKMIYQWDKLESCYTVEKWDENTFYIETGDENYIDIGGSMLMDVNGNVIKQNIFSIGSKKVEYTFRKNVNNSYVETQALQVRKLFIEK